MVAGRGADHTALGGRVGEVRDLVIRAAQLEGENRLQILALEQHLVADATAEPRGRFERRFDRDVVDARLEDAFEIIVRHRLRDGARELFCGCYGSRNRRRSANCPTRQRNFALIFRRDLQ